jgi:hypothetical protein
MLIYIEHWNVVNSCLVLACNKLTYFSDDINLLCYLFVSNSF